MERGIVIFLGLLIAGIGFWFADMAMSEWQPAQSAEVVTRAYDAAHTTVGTGTAIGSDGQVHVVTTTTSEPEKWTVVIRLRGQVLSATASPGVWAECKEGRKVNARWSKGFFTGANYGWAVWSLQ